MSEPYQPGFLAFAPLRLDYARVRPCPRCRGDERERRWNEVCGECKADPEYQARYRRKQNFLKRQNHQRRMDGTVAAPGRPRKEAGGAWT